MRIGINVPNELVKRIKQIRPAVNVSLVSREALEKRAEFHERVAAQVAADDIEEHIQRLAESGSGSLIEPDWESYGLEDARDWVRAVTPETWDRFIYQYDHLVGKGRSVEEMVDLWSASNNARGLPNRLDENSEWFIEQYDVLISSGSNDNLHDRATREYAQAWLSYVVEVRSRLEKRRKEEYERVMAEREEERQSLKSAELPSQLI